MAFVNDNYCNLKDSYLFSQIAQKVNAYVAEHPEKKVIRKKKKRYAISEDFNLKHLSFSIIYTVYIIKTTITDDKWKPNEITAQKHDITYFSFNRKDSEIITKERETNWRTRFSIDGILAINAKGIHKQSKYLKFLHKCKIPIIQNKE